MKELFGNVWCVDNDNRVVFYGKLYTLLALYWFIRARPIVRWWVGTDSMTLIKFPPGYWAWAIRIRLHRIKAKLTEFMIAEHWYGCEQVHAELLTFGIRQDKCRFMAYPPLYPQKVNRNRPTVIAIIPRNALKGRNRKYKHWFFGVDIVNTVMAQFKDDVNWLIADGTIDMSTYYTVADAVILPKRITGNPRVVEECNINSIPCFYENGEPTIEGNIRFIHQVKSDYQASANISQHS